MGWNAMATELVDGNLLRHLELVEGSCGTPHQEPDGFGQQHGQLDQRVSRWLLRLHP